MKQIIRKTAVAGTLVASVAAAATVVSVVREPVPVLDAQSAPSSAAAAVDLASAFRDASRSVLPAVVSVDVVTEAQAVSRQIPEGFRGTPFEDFFGGGVPMQRAPTRGSGSGFIISADGYVVTNNHVVANASRVKVTLNDNREFDATVVGRDPNTDVAVVKIEGSGFPTVKLGDADELEVGDWVLALGYPLSLGETVTAGIVSAKGRSLGIIEQTEEAQNPLEHFIQTDAAINPGNSGGPLVNLKGEVIGVNTAIASPTGTYAGYGFAVPVSLARRVAEDLIRDGVVTRPKLGVVVGEVTPADVEVFRLPEARGAVVVSVQDGPAKDAGLQMGDVIMSVGGKAVSDRDDVLEQIAIRRPGETVALDVVRYGDSKRVNVRLGSFETERAVTTAAPLRTNSPQGRLGFAATEVTPQIASQLRLPTVEGVIVTQIDPTSPAARGLQRGFRIDRLNGQRITSMADLDRAASRLEPGSTVSIVGVTPQGHEAIVNFKVNG